MTRNEILQAKNNLNHYMYELHGYFLSNAYEIEKLSLKDLQILQKIDKTLDTINEIASFILEDMRGKKNE